MTKRKICVVTGSRADFGHLYWLMKEIQNDESLEFQLIVTGMHLSQKFGMTINEIYQAGLPVSDKVEMLLPGDSHVSITKSIGIGVIGFADSLEKLAPDIIVLLGDRFEILAAAQAAMIANIPIAHLHGGEATYGSVDESIRNAITKMSNLHFVAAKEYAYRVLQMGENPSYVFNYGPPGQDSFLNLKILERKKFEESIKFNLGDTNFLVTYHPSTWSNKKPTLAIEQLLLALESFNNSKIIFTMPNADVDNKEITCKIKKFVESNSERAVMFESLGQLRYFSAISYVDVVIGNSSSGLTEVPYFRKPTVNIGFRQEGRLYSSSVIHCEEDALSIKKSIEIAMSSDFLSKINGNDLFIKNNISKKIKDKLKEINLKDLMVKKFCNYAEK